MKHERLCTECEEFFEVDYDIQKLKARDRAAEIGGFPYVCPDCSGEGNYTRLISDDWEEFYGDDEALLDAAIRTDHEAEMAKELLEQGFTDEEILQEILEEREEILIEDYDNSL